MVGLKKLNWQEATSGYLHTSVAEDFELGMTDNKPSKWSERNLNPSEDCWIASPRYWPLSHTTVPVWYFGLNN